MAGPRLSPGFSPLSYPTACAPFTPSNSEQRSLPPYYRGCWHGVSRSFFRRYRHCVRPCRKGFTYQDTSSPTRRCLVRLAPIAKNSPLLPPVGVWTVFQFQCGRPPSQAGYRSKPWWAIPPPTSYRTRAHLQAPGLAVPGFDPEARSPRVLCGISTSFPMLFPTRRKITHALLTRSLLSWGCPLKRSTCMC